MTILKNLLIRTGESKLIVEQVLGCYGRAYGLCWTALRYFNAAGADPDGEIGEAHYPETHLIPRAIAAAHGDVPELEVFETDYETPARLCATMFTSPI